MRWMEGDQNGSRRQQLSFKVDLVRRRPEDREDLSYQVHVHIRVHAHVTSMYTRRKSVSLVNALEEQIIMRKRVQ